MKGSNEKTIKSLPIGISDYVRAQSEYYYVDKTLLIKEFLDRRPLVSLFTIPRRFGKTLNMDILLIKLYGIVGKSIGRIRENILLYFLLLKMSNLIHGKRQ